MYDEEVMVNRYICSVLEEMRAADKVKNYSYMAGMIEEAQVLANRMEAALYDKDDLNRAHDEAKKVRDEVKKLREEKKKLEAEIKDAKGKLSKQEKKEAKVRYKGEQAEIARLKAEIETLKNTPKYTTVNMCPRGGECEYPLPWVGFGAPPCLKCSQSAPFLTTVTDSTSS